MQTLERENSELRLQIADMQRGLEQSIAKFHTIVSMTEDSARSRDLDIAWIAREGQACCIAHMNEEGMAEVEEMLPEVEDDVAEVEAAMLYEAEDDMTHMTHADRLRATGLFNRKAIEYIMDFDTSPPFDSVYHHPLSAGPEPAEDRWVREDIPF